MSTIEDAIKVPATIVGTITLEQYKNLRAEKRADIHVIRHQPGGDLGGDAA